MKQQVLTFFADKELVKLFVYQVSVRRNFFPFMSVFFLLQPNTNLQQLGIFMGVGFITQILFELPSGYLADRWGHKKTLAVSKLMAIGSVLFYLLGGTLLSNYAFACFTVAVLFQSLMFTANSGTFSAFFHEFLESRGEEKKFTEILSKQRGKISLISVLFIFGLPFFSEILVFFPFVIALIIDIIGYFAIVSVKPVDEGSHSAELQEKSIQTIFSEARQLQFIPVAFFLGLIGGLQIGHGAFRTVYLSELGLPLVLIGSVMALSRVFRYLMSNYMHVLEQKFTMKQQFLFEIIVFSGAYFIVALFQNLYVVGLIFALMIAYQWARGALMDKYVLKRYVTDKRYKATVLSIKGIFNNIIAAIISFGIGYFMNISYQTGFLILGFISIIGLSISYYFIFRKKDDSKITNI